MEFDVKIPELGDGNMYAFWKDRQTNILIHDVRQGDGILLNLASLDIQPSFQWKEVERSVRIITPEFKIWKNGKAETIVIYAKMCRGQMSRYQMCIRDSSSPEFHDRVPIRDSGDSPYRLSTYPPFDEGTSA